MESMTVVTAQPGDLAKELKDHLATWTAAGLIRSFLWVDGDRLGDELTAVGSLEAELITASGTSPGYLLDLIADNDVERLRLLVVRMIESGDERLWTPRPGLARLERRLAVGGAAGQTLTSINLVVPVSDCGPVSDHLLEPTWAANVVWSPEQRAAPNLFDPGVDSEALVAHATLGAVTVGGLWFSMTESPLDGRRLSQSGEGRLVLMRSFVRLLLTQSIAADVTDGIFGSRNGSHWAATAVNAVPAPDPVAVSTSLSNAFVRDAGLEFSPAAPKGMPPKKKPNYRGAIPEMFRFVGALVRSGAEALADRYRPKGLEALLEQLTRIPEEEGSDERPPEPGADIATATHAAASFVLTQMNDAPAPPATGEVWQELRATTFAAVDGGEFPARIDAPKDGAHRLVVVDLEHVAPAPDAHPTVTIDAHPELASAICRLRPCDPLQARVLRSLVAREHAEASTAAAPEEGEPAHDESVSDAESDEEMGAPEPAPDAEAARQLELAAASLDEWIASRERSLLWKVGTRVASAIVDARASFDAHFARVLQGAPEGDAAAGSRALASLKRWWTIWGLISLAGALAGAALYLPRGWDYYWIFSEGIRLRGPVVIASSLVLWLVSWTLVHLRYRRRVLWLEHRQAVAMQSYLNELEGARNDAQEMHRLSSAYIQYRDWAEILSWMVRRPEGSGVALEDAAAVDPGLDVPRSFRVAQAESSSTKIEEAVAAAGRKSFFPGWLSNLYSSYLDAAKIDLRRHLGSGADEGEIDPDRDSFYGRDRRFVLEKVADGGYGKSWVRRIHSSVVGHLAGTTADELFDRIVPLGIEGGSGSGARDRVKGPSDFLQEIVTDAEAAGARKQEDEAVNAQPFAPDVLTNRAQMDGAAKVEETYLWFSGARPKSVASSPRIKVVPPAEDAPRLIPASLRVDVSGICDQRAFNIFPAPRPPAEPEYEEGTDDDDL